MRPTLARPTIRPLASFLAGLGLVAALAGVPAAQGVGATARPATADVLAAAGLGAGDIQVLDLPADAGAAFSFALELEGGLREIHVEPHSVRAPGYELRVRDLTGTVVYPPSVETSYRGTVDGYPESLVAVNLFEGQVQGILRLTAGAPWYGVQPVSALVPKAPHDEHLVYVETAVLPTGARCGGAIDVLRDGTGGEPGAPPAPLGADLNPKVCEIAIDSDVEFFQKNGSSVLGTQNDITNVINAVEAIYQTTADVSYAITVIYVETAEPDPYSTTDSGTLLNQFKSHWNASHGADQRDIAHLFTGKNIAGSVIGIAYLNVICNKSQGYGLSQSKFSGSFTYRTGLTAHELGHNWSANHCDGASDCWIMCSGIGGCAGSVTKFGSNSTNKINNKKASSGCLSTPPPPTAPFLTSLTPSAVQAFQGGQVSLNGLFLGDVTSVDVGGTVLTVPFGATIQSDNQVTINPPAPAALGTVQVKAINAAGSSNSLPLTYVETDPPKLGATGVALTGFAFNWSMGAQVGDLWFLLVAVNDGTTIPYLGSSLLVNGILVGSGTLSSVGLGGFGLVVPPGAAGATVYSQAVLFDGGSFAFEGATNVTISSILL